MRLILVRHGETELNRQHRIQGRGDSELNETGRTQAEAIARALKDSKVAAIYSSPLTRARDTADRVARFHTVDVVTLEGLQEMDAGEVDGLTYEEMAAKYGDFLEKWMRDCTAVRPPGGSTLHEVQDGAWSAVQEILRRERARDQDCEQAGARVIVAVAHFFPILSILCKALGLELSECRRFRVDLASMCTLDFNHDRTVLVSLNDTCHLRE